MTHLPEESNRGERSKTKDERESVSKSLAKGSGVGKKRARRGFFEEI
jgi:hypothetical protein